MMMTPRRTIVPISWLRQNHPDQQLFHIPLIETDAP